MKTMKKILSLALVVAMVLSLASVGVFAADNTTTAQPTHIDVGTGDTYTDANGTVWTVIREYSDFTTDTDGTKTYHTNVENGRFILANDINCSAAFTSGIKLGNGTILEGNGYAFTQVSLAGSSATASNNGLFALNSDSTITVQNLTFKDATVSDCLIVRTMASENANTNWINVDVSVTLTRQGGNPAAFFSGIQYGTHNFTDCDVVATYTPATDDDGDYTTYAQAPGVVAGFVSVLGNSTNTSSAQNDVTVNMTNCTADVNFSTVLSDGSKGSTVAGLIGQALYQNQEPTDAHSYTNVTLTDCEVSGTLIGMNFAGGLIAYTAAPTVITGCINNAAVTGKQISADCGTAGIVGRFQPITSYYKTTTVTQKGDEAPATTTKNNAYITGANTLTIVNTVNNGTITGTRYAAGFVAQTYATNTTIINCVNNGQVGYTEGQSTSDANQNGRAAGFVAKHPELSVNTITYGDPVVTTTEADGVTTTTTTTAPTATATSTACTVNISYSQNKGNMKNLDTTQKSDGNGRVAGFVGDGAKNVTINIDNSINYAGFATSADTVFPNQASGFVIGTDNETVNLSYCLNAGDVYNCTWAVGFVRRSLNVNIDNCVNIGNMDGCTNTAQFVGGIKTSCVITNSYGFGSTKSGVTTKIFVNSGSPTVTNCYYTATAADSSVTNATYMTSDEATAELAARYHTVDGVYKIKSIKAVQNTSGDPYKIRVLGVVNDDVATYNKVGYTVTTKINGAATSVVDKDVSLKYVYNNVVATNLSGSDTQAYTAADLGGKYIASLVFTDVPATGAVEITATLWVEQVVNGVTVRYNLGETAVITYTNGNFTSAAAAN